MGPELIIAPIALTLWLVAFGLLRRLHHQPPPAPEDARSFQPNHVSVVIPARDEAHNLPRLLDSLNRQPQPPLEVIVVDDHSTDATAEIAAARGARVIPARPLPDDWRGKPWACHQGAEAAAGELLLFVDADCWFEPGGLAKMLAAYHGGALSVAPFHQVERPYEELSAFFNAIMVASLVPHGLFGQTLLVDRASYESAGGHLPAKNRVLENLRLGAAYRAADLPVASLPGRGLVGFRMYPAGLASLVEGWTKGFASGAAETPRRVVIAISAWITGLMLAISALPFAAWTVVIYLAFALQFGLMLRRVGSFSPLTALLYPIPLFFYFAVFARSRRSSGKTVTWKGREFRAD